MTNTTPLPRDAFDLDPSVLWVMHCAEGLVPRAAAAAAAELMTRELRPWAMRWEQDMLGIPARVRALGAAVLGARAGDMSLLTTTSSGLVTVAQGLAWQPGDEVLTPAGEFPSNSWPWRVLASRGVAVREVPLWDGHRSGAAAWESTPPPAGCDPEARIVEAIGPRTRVVAVSWVRFQDGLRLDLARLGEAVAARGAALVVDGIQGAGTLLPDLRHVAAFATGGHKGLLAPQGLGFLWTSPEFRALVTPPGGWLSLEDATNFDRPNTDFEREFVTDGTRFEQGVPNLLSGAAFEVSLELLNRAGIASIANHVAFLERTLLARLAARGARQRECERLLQLLDAGRLGSIVSFHHDGGGPDALNAALRSARSKGIYASVREGYLRVALHGWHDEEDVGRLVQWLG